jgi:hypothetical protein
VAPGRVSPQTTLTGASRPMQTKAWIDEKRSHHYTCDAARTDWQRRGLCAKRDRRPNSQAGFCWWAREADFGCGPGAQGWLDPGCSGDFGPGCSAPSSEMPRRFLCCQGKHSIDRPAALRSIPASRAGWIAEQPATARAVDESHHRHPDRASSAQHKDTQITAP